MADVVQRWQVEVNFAVPVEAQPPPLVDKPPVVFGPPTYARSRAYRVCLFITGYREVTHGTISVRCGAPVHWRLTSPHWVNGKPVTYPHYVCTAHKNFYGRGDGDYNK